MHSQPQVLFEDNHLLVLDKPAGVPTIGTGPDRPGLAGWAREYLRQRYHKPGNVFIGVVSRLDSAVTGVIALARTSKAASRLSEQFRNREPIKTYWALVDHTRGEGCPAPEAGKLVHLLHRDERLQRMVARPRPETGARPASGLPLPQGTQLAELEILRGLPCGKHQLLEIRLLTGRKHQIRVQLAASGWPILGDQKYGSRVSFPVGIALHSHQLDLIHPVRRTVLTIQASPPGYWPRGWQAWDVAPKPLSDQPGQNDGP